MMSAGMYPNKNLMIENLAFEGGGVRGIAYAGALKTLEGENLLANVKRVAGTSAGAFAALVLSLGGGWEALDKTLRALHFEALEDKPNPLRIPPHYGLYKGEVLYNWIAGQLTNAGLSETLTFQELAATGALDLKVFATDLTVCNVREFSAEHTPDASVVGAVRASMSIPLMYAPWQFPDHKPDDHVYVDGGTVYNYPISAFDGAESNPHTLGFCFRTTGKHEAAAIGKDHFFAYSKRLFAAVLSAQMIDFEQNPDQKKRSVIIDDLGFKATDLSLPEKDFDRLFAAGETATRNYLGLS